MVASAIPLLLLGFSLGMRHATDADHVIAVATIVSRIRSLAVALLIGAMWGLGHTVTLLLVGGAILLFGIVVPPHLGLAMELAVAIMLIGLGAMHFARSAHALHHAHAGHAHAGHAHAGHAHAGHAHAGGDHAGAHDLGWADRRFAGSRLYVTARPMLIGVVHGLAGSAAVALLVLTTVRDARWGIAYLLVFGAGTVAGMMLITAALAVPFALASARFARMHCALGLFTGLLSLGFGCFLAYEIGFVSGLFTAHPHWTPG